jgi:endoglucanase
MLALATGLAACGGGPSGGAGTATAPPSAPPTVSINDFPPMAAGPAVAVSPAALARVQAMGRGINFGNMLEPPREGDWGLRVEDRFIDLVGEPGFVSSVRLPVRWSNHASTDAAAVIDPAFFERVDSVVQRLLAKNVTVVLNMHHYRQLDGDPLDPGETSVDAAVVELRFLSMWRQIARRYANQGSALVFEIYNEPHGRLDARWNDLLSRALRVIRESNPDRVVVVGPVVWNSPTALPRLVIPPDPNLVLTVHHYEPFNFTHQGAEWISPALPLNVSCCDAAQQQTINTLLDQTVRESQRLGRPVFVGEFGAYSKAAQDSRLTYMRTMRQAMAQRGLPWMYWELAAGFGVYDPQSGRFRDDMKQVLYGP